MEGEQINGGSVKTVPLLVNINEEKHIHEGDQFCDERGEDGHLVSDTSFFKTCFNGLNALSGVGILSVPYALSSGGWLSLILLFIIAILTFYTGLLMKRCMDMDPDIKSYPDIGEHAFGKTGRTIVSITMHLELYMVATGFLILEGDNLHKLLPDMSIEIINGFNIGGTRSFVIIVGLIILPTVWLDNMNILSYISATGVISSMVLLVSVFWAGTFDGIGFHNKGRLINWKGLPTAVSLYAFCFCAHPVFPTLYTSMRIQKQFSQVLQVCFLISTFSYALMAVLGYLMFGSDLTSQITLNLPTDSINSKVAIYTTLINPIAKYALMVTPMLDSFEARFISQRPYRRLLSLVIRTTLVASTIVVALSLPFFGQLMSLVGAFLSITGSVLLPCFCFLKISGIYESIGLELIFICCILLMGLIIMIVGTYVALMDIMVNLSQ
ncbi:hypothetical protein LIER_40153 [Lithospermum erythrorhizon]|uniref:Amino acid transporter transmembrane domain-containing protein n=1 Tax=Lithospermum erythrorhizon TaxID=34254 RepID=A0AAV3QRA8_LITER